MNELHVEMRRADTLAPYPHNARTHSEAQIAEIARSMQEFGWTNPILVDGENGVIAGHGRLLAASRLGIDVVPVIELAHLTPAQRRALILADNRIALSGGWDAELLTLELSELKELGVDLNILGFTDEEILVALEPIEPGLTDPDEAPEPPATAISKPGDLWILGKHRVLRGDSTCPADVERLMAGEQADCVWTDPPYNVAYEGAAGKIANDDMDAAGFAAFLAAAFGCAFAALRLGAPAYVAHADTEGLAFRRAFVEAGFKLSSCLIWRKNSLVLGRSDYQWQHEPVLYGWKPGAAHSWFGGRDKTTVFDVPRPSRSEQHPTMKPVELIERMLACSTKLGSVVLDLFGGSGSTLIACERLGRAARLVELDARFVDVIVRRWQEYTGRKAVLDETGRTFAQMTGERSQEAA